MIMPGKFRKKPVVIEARQLSEANAKDIASWCGGRPGKAGVIIPTLEGAHNASIGDWIICGVKGEFYPCKPDIFSETYEVAT